MRWLKYGGVAFALVVTSYVLASADARAKIVNLTVTTTTAGLKEALNVMLVDSSGTSLSPPYDVNVSQINGATPTADVTSDYDTGAGTQTQSLTGIAAPASGGGLPWLIDPCQLYTKSAFVVDLTSTTTTKLVSGTASKKTYICSLQLVTATAQNIGIWSGTKTSTECDTGKGKMFGGSTAATGWNLAANGGLTFGNGGYWVAVSGAAADDVCIASSSTGQISANGTYVQAP